MRKLLWPKLGFENISVISQTVHVTGSRLVSRRKKFLFSLTVHNFLCTVELSLSGLIGTASHPDMQKMQIIGFFFANGLHWQFEVEKNSTNGSFRLHIYLRTNTTLIHNFLYVFDSWGTNLNHKEMQSNYSKKMFTRIAKPFRITGDPDNRRPDKWSSIVLHFSRRVSTPFLPSVCICHTLFSFVSFHGQVC